MRLCLGWDWFENLLSGVIEFVFSLWRWGCIVPCLVWVLFAALANAFFGMSSYPVHLLKVRLVPVAGWRWCWIG